MPPPPKKRNRTRVNKGLIKGQGNGETRGIQDARNPGSQGTQRLRYTASKETLDPKGPRDSDTQQAGTQKLKAQVARCLGMLMPRTQTN